MYMTVLDILFFVFPYEVGSGGGVCFPFLGFACVELPIACIFMGAANFLGLEVSF